MNISTHIFNSKKIYCVYLDFANATERPWIAIWEGHVVDDPMGQGYSQKDAIADLINITGEEHEGFCNLERTNEL